jgi:cytochrome c oxidase subunit IV
MTFYPGTFSVLFSLFFLENPFFGTGIGNLNNKLYHKYQANSFDSSAAVFVNGHVESVYFSIIATYGSIGFIMFTNFIFRLTNYLFKYFKTDSFLRPYTFAWVVLLINMITNPGVIVDYRLTMFFIIFLSIPFLKFKNDS